MIARLVATGERAIVASLALAFLLGLYWAATRPKSRG